VNISDEQQKKIFFDYEEINGIIGVISKVLTEEHVYGDEFCFEDGIFKGGTLMGLIKSLIYYTRGSYRENLVNLILIYRRYVSSVEFFDILVDIYNNLPIDSVDNHIILVRIISIIKYWFKNYIVDFKDLQLVEKVNIFIESLSKGIPAEKSWANDILKTWKAAFVDKTKLEEIKTIYPDEDPILSTKIKNIIENNVIDEIDFSELHITDFNPLELARQITLKDQNILKKIPLAELNYKTFEKPECSPFSQQANNFVNFMANWIAWEILNEPVLKKRIKVLTHCILFCEKLRMLQNFNSLFSVYSGLSQYPISRLRSTWAGLPAIVKKKWKDIQDLMNPVGNFLHLRTEQYKAKIPLVPSLTILLHDLILIEEGNIEFLDNEKNFINFEKGLLLGSIFRGFIRVQKFNYPITRVEIIHKYLERFQNQEYNADELEKLSMIVEPNHY